MAITPTKKYIDINGLGFYHEESAPEMTYAEWQALPASKLSDGREYHITDLTVSGVEISDSVTTTTNVWSASKVNTELGNKANTSAIPTTLASLSDDSTHRLVTDTEKSTWSGKQNALTFDNSPTANSDNPVKSGGVYTALASKANTSDLPVLTSAVSALTGATSCTITNSAIHTTSLIEPMASVQGMGQPTMTITEGQCLLEFSALAQDTSFRLRITN